MLARASRTDVPVGAGGAAGAEGAGVVEALPRTEPRAFVGGLPGGVVDSSTTSHMLDYMLQISHLGGRTPEKRTLWWCAELFSERLEH
jgi:hypothetical protein